jgi:hypothetical protein
MTTVNANFNKILIIQSLNDYLTGNKLQDDLNILTIFTDGIVSSELIDARDKKAFLSTLVTIKKDVRIPTQVATRFRFIAPPDSDLSRHPIPREVAT